LEREEIGERAAGRDPYESQPLIAYTCRKKLCRVTVQHNSLT
jgi:hypothetical protein